MEDLTQWQIVRIKKTGELGTLIRAVVVEGKVSVILPGLKIVDFAPDEIEPIGSADNARSESAFRQSFWCVLSSEIIYLAQGAIFAGANTMRYALGGMFFTVALAVGYYIFKNTRTPEPPLS